MKGLEKCRRLWDSALKKKTKKNKFSMWVGLRDVEMIYSTQNRRAAEVLQVERTQKCIAVDAVA